MKFYDKDIYNKDEAIKSTIMVLIIFLIGFIIGSFAVNTEIQKENNDKQQHIIEIEKLLEEKESKIFEQFIEIDSLKETVYMLEIYGK